MTEETFEEFEREARRRFPNQPSLRPSAPDIVKPNIFVALPAFGYVNCAHTTCSLFNLAATLTMRGIGCGIGTLSCPDIADARSIFLSLWYDKLEAFTHILFVDADMRFLPDLVADMIVFNKPVTGVIYRKKDDKAAWVGEFINGPQNVENGFIRTEHLGFGIILISRDAIEAMIHKYPELVFDVPDGSKLHSNDFGPHKLNRVLRFFTKIPMGHTDMSEDYAFCHRWLKTGGEIYANVAHEIGHVGLKTYTGRFWDEIQKHDLNPVPIE